VLAGDHIYKMDYEVMLRQHVDSGADVTVGCLEMPRAESSGFGIMHIDENGWIQQFLEKPKDPPSNLAVTGIYFYDESVYEIIASLRPSGRGELEITDVNNAFIARGNLTFDVLPGWWTDAGTFESLKHASTLADSLPRG